MTKQDTKKTIGRAKYRCRRCGRRGGVIRKYNLLYCRNCMREVAKQLGFKKYN